MDMRELIDRYEDRIKRNYEIAKREAQKIIDSEEDGPNPVGFANYALQSLTEAMVYRQVVAELKEEIKSQ